ncbi:MAG: S-formylglutathione hydrolase [Pseudomonadota bacterium]|nr:MAG: S-formylglutathione hydrolase [Pseudomonadota bacterium]
MQTIKQHKVFDGWLKVCRHDSSATGSPMEFAVWLPPQSEDGPVPVLYWLSGLTCTWENFAAKAAAFGPAAEHGIAIVMPDTSPRGLGLPGEDGDYDFGSGAGFYVDATVTPWADHYRMYTYVTEELPGLVESQWPLDGKQRGIFGHSMGGHGALVYALRKPDRYRSVSAFAPIVNPVDVPWGQKAFSGYLGADQSAWAAWDASRLIGNSSWDRPIRIDQGEADDFLGEQLQPEVFDKACSDAGVPLELHRHDGYDHSYYFIATFMADHLAWHARQLQP